MNNGVLLTIKASSTGCGIPTTQKMAVFWPTLSVPEPMKLAENCGLC
jgi:hypothetical protein